VSDVIDRIEAVFADAGARGFLHAHEIGADGPSVSVGGDEPVVLASVFKIPVAVAFAREVEAGRVDETETATVSARYRIGGIGTAGCADDVRMSLRDLASFMLTMSDNAATDVIWHRLGSAAVKAVLADLGLTGTRIIGCCEDLFRTIAEDLGGGDDLDAALAAASEEQLRGLAVLDPARTSASTPRELGALLDAIWTDRAAPPAACERVRTTMARQIWPHRLSSGFGSDVTIAAKTGTLPTVRNECGVVTYPDGRRYAVAVFTRTASFAERQPAVDAAIGRAARIAVDHLR
jgi:beta-lactamase class A